MAPKRKRVKSEVKSEDVGLSNSMALLPAAPQSTMAPEPEGKRVKLENEGSSNSNPKPCPNCNKKKGNMIAHQKRRRKAQEEVLINPQKCRYCKTQKGTTKAITDHMRDKHPKEFASYCDRCEKQFPDEPAFSIHYWEYSSKHWICYICCPPPHYNKKDYRLKSKTDPDFASEKEMNAHLKSAHGRIPCINCDKIFETDLELQHHTEKKHWHEVCKACDIAFQFSSELEKHQKTHPKEPIDCLGCSRKFGVYSEMMMHLESGTCMSRLDDNKIAHVVASYHEGLGDRFPRLRINFECPTCDKKVKKMSDLFRHFERRFCPLRNWKDETHVEDLFLAMQDSLKDGVVKESYICWPRSLKKLRHPSKCLRCEQMFKSSSAMMLHLESGDCESEIAWVDISDVASKSLREFKYTCYHDGIFECPSCKKSFDRFSSLLKHAEGYACEVNVLSGPIRELMTEINRRL